MAVVVGVGRKTVGRSGQGPGPEGLCLGSWAWDPLRTGQMIHCRMRGLPSLLLPWWGWASGMGIRGLCRYLLVRNGPSGS